MMDTQNVVYPDGGLLHGHKNNEAVTPATVWVSLKTHAE